MADQEAERRAQGRRLQLARSHMGLESPTEAAARFRWNRETYTQHENGTRGLRRAVEDYATAFGVSEEWLLWGRNPPSWLTPEQLEATAPPPIHVKPPLRLVKGSELAPPTPPGVSEPASNIGLRPVHRIVPVIGEVQAGIWREATALDLNLAKGFDPRDLDELKGERLEVDVPGFERAVLFALRVRGPSMNRFYRDGSFVIAAPPAEAGLQHEDHVIVQRNRTGLIETTVKEFVLHPDGQVELWPRSTDEAYQTPMMLNPRDHDQDRPMIVGVVVADYNRRQRSGRPAYLPESHAE